MHREGLDFVRPDLRYQTPTINMDRLRALGGRSVHWNAVFATLRTAMAWAQAACPLACGHTIVSG
jgi:hypothetical protein